MDILFFQLLHTKGSGTQIEALSRGINNLTVSGSLAYLTLEDLLTLLL